MAVKSWSTAHRKVEVPVRTLAYVRRTASALCIVIFQVEKSHQFSHWEPVMKLESHSELALVADREIRTCLSKAVGLDLNEKKNVSARSPRRRLGINRARELWRTKKVVLGRELRGPILCGWQDTGREGRYPPPGRQAENAASHGIS